MKKLIVLFFTLAIIGCKKQEPKDYATISGKIENADESKILKISKGQIYTKEISLNDDGTFKDTLKIEAGDYSIQHGNQRGVIYLKNDNESSFTADYKDFTKSITFSGDASDTNNFSIQSFLISNVYFTEELFLTGKKEDINNAIKNYKDAYADLKIKYTNVDSIHVALMDRNIEGSVQQINRYMASKVQLREEFPAGSPSPIFKDYENFAGGNKSLPDFIGKYVYIDIWATWCGPCIKEIPSLKKIEKQFQDKNIEFVSISVDEGRGYKGDAAAAYKGWKAMVADKNLGGIQLIADKAFNSQFIRDYKINGIPRFILIDPKGNIVSADAPRPSSQELIKLFNSL